MSDAPKKSTLADHIHKNTMTREELEKLGMPGAPARLILKTGRGCPHCHETGYYEREGIYEVLISDERIRELIEDGYIPSFCTSCYRIGRTGEHFMEYAIPGFIQRFCTPNALLTLEEYLADYASPETRAESCAIELVLKGSMILFISSRISLFAIPYPILSEASP